MLAETAAFAEESDAFPRALALYGSGAFVEAAELAEREESAEGLTLAARAMLAFAAYRAPQEERQAALAKGESLARRALEKNPDYVEALLNLSIALGYRSRMEGPMKAHVAGHGSEAQGLIAKAIEREPNSAWAHAADGGWNAEVVRRGGGLLASLIYGASKKKAFRAFETAVSLSPEISVIRLEFAKALLRVGSKAQEDVARDHLEAALSRAPVDAMEGIAQEQARRLLEALDSGDKEQLENTLVAITPFEE